MYSDLRIRLEEIIENEDNFIANASNFIALLFSSIQDINWVGLYFVKGNNLLLGPFQGKIACMRIPSGKGVCGTSLKNKRTTIVEDVHKFPGHIPCDPNSNSEIVIPLIYNDKVFGVLDIDSPSYNRFSLNDKEKIEELLDLLIRKSNVNAIIEYYSN